VMPTKRKKAPVHHGKRGKTAEKGKEPKSYPDADPEWEHLEERYSQIGSEMRSLAKLLNVTDGGGEQ